jgi:hypothetical protein
MPTEEPASLLPEGKQISNPFSTGGGGPRFEVQVMSAFAVLMLAGSFVPCLPCLPIRSIRLQARQAGYRTDDFVAHVSDASQTDKRRLLAQIKHGISFIKSNEQFREAVAAAWKDFNNPARFTRGKDAIAIIAGPLSAIDIEDTRKILEWARSCASPHEYFEKVGTTNFSSKEKRDKLAYFRAHIDAAAGVPVKDEEIFEFLRHVHILGFDLDVCSGVMHALLHGIIRRQNAEDPIAVWAKILQHVDSWNTNAGTLTVDSFPDDVRAVFAPRPVETIPASLASTLPPKTTSDWKASEFADALVVASLLGGWNEVSEADMAIVAVLAKDQPREWLRMMRACLQHPESPLSHANGVWTVRNRTALWSNLANRIFGDTLNRFQGCAKTVLRERDPKFALEPEQRFAAQIHGKVMAHSEPLRNGISETLAMFGTNTAQLPNCGPSAGEGTAIVIIREVFEKTDWQLWASLDRLLPTLAEAAPKVFLDAVEKALIQPSCPFDALFAQERSVFSGGTYISGLLWALETLAWDETHTVRVSVALAMLAARDPGGNWSNRPANSLTTIFLPWFPQTRASTEKRIVAVKTVLRERREVGWRLLMSLLPHNESISSGTHKPKWRNKIDLEKVPKPTNQEYWDQVSSYAQMAIDFVRSDSDKLKELIGSLDSLPELALTEVLTLVESETVLTLPDERRLPIWTELSSFVKKHRRYADAQWALPATIVDKVDAVASKLAPQDPAIRHRFLFANDTVDLYDDVEDWQKSEVRLAQRRVDAIREIFHSGGIEGAKAFATKVEDPSSVGVSMGKLDANVTNDLLPNLVLSSDPKLRQLVQGYVWAMWQCDQWEWFDKLDKGIWSKDQTAQVLTYLPFDAETWKRADQMLTEDAKEYWTRVPIHRIQRGDSEYLAVDALLKHGRPRSAVACLAARVYAKLPLDPDRTIITLLAAATSKETDARIDKHASEMVIKALQDCENTDKNKLMLVEWAYLTLLQDSQLVKAKTLYAAIASDPQLFCEIIRKIFRSDREMEREQKPEPTEEESAVGENAYRLLRVWNTVPGTDGSGGVSAELLTKWIDAVKRLLAESGHLSIGLQKAGEVFIHGPGDSGGLFIHQAIAAILNREDMAELREGYELAVYNSRGVHAVDPTGAPEKELAATYRQRAEAVENAGYHRLAVSLRSIADRYMREADHYIARFAAEDRQNKE